MPRTTKTFIFSINRTILGKTGSHGSFVSCKPAWLDFFEMTDKQFETKNNVFDRKNFYLREEYYGAAATDLLRCYRFGLEKAGKEFRLSSIKGFFNDTGMTETDHLIIEMINDNGNVYYLAGKSTKENYIIMEKYADNSGYWVWDNSINTEMWEDMTDDPVMCSIRDEKGKVSKKEIIISPCGTVEIDVGDSNSSKKQKKTLFQIKYYDDQQGEWKEFDESSLIGIEKKDGEFILTYRAKTVDYKKIECRIL